MELKKNESVDLEKRKSSFQLFGLLIALGFTLLAFEWSSSAGAVVELTGDNDIVIEDDQIPITRQNEPPPPPPPPPPKVSEVLTIVEDDVEVEEEFEMEDVEAKEDTQIEQVEQVVEEEAEEEVFLFVENMPEFPGGERALRVFIAKNVRYPTIARENNIQGTVYVRFVVTETGAVENVNILRGVDPLLDAEATRVVKTLPKWKPGEQRGKNVKVWYNVPIKFQLQ